MESLLTPSLRKAAVLIRSLDAESAAVLLAQLSPDEARSVRQAIRELTEIDPLEQEELRNELRPVSPEVKTDDEGGVELSLSTVKQVPEETTATPLSEVSSYSPTPYRSDQPFAWLERGDMPSLAAMLEREHLSTVAVVLSHLSADQASQVLTALPPTRRAAALERLADLGESDRSCLEVIERELAEWIASQKAERQRRADRLKSIQAILKHSSGDTCKTVLADIARHDQSLAAEIGPMKNSGTGNDPCTTHVNRVAQQVATLGRGTSMPAATNSRFANDSVKSSHNAEWMREPVIADPSFAFERITELDERQLAELFRHCPGDSVVLALAGAAEPISAHVERLLPKSVAKELRRRMHALQSVRLTDFVAAQREIALTASRLFEPTSAKRVG